MAQINDAVMVTERGCSVTKVVLRVQAISEGRAMILNKYSYELEDRPGQWPIVGRFVKAGIFRRWQFVPSEK